MISYKKSINLAKTTAVYILVIMGAFLVALPFIWMLSTALKPLEQVFLFPPKWIPEPIQWHNFMEGWRLLPFTRYLGNTAFITASAMFGEILSCSLVAFGFARLNAPGKNALFLLVLSTMMLPPQVTIIPSYILFRYLGWNDSFKPLIVPAFFASRPFFVFLMRQFYMGIPREMDEAARIDGCSTFGIYARLILPLSKPVIASVAIFSFMFNWQEFLRPLIYLNSDDKFTLALGLNMLRATEASGFTPWNQLMAVAILIIMAPLLVFFFAQKHFIQGVVVTGIKG